MKFCKIRKMNKCDIFQKSFISRGNMCLPVYDMEGKSLVKPGHFESQSASRVKILVDWQNFQLLPNVQNRQRPMTALAGPGS